MKGFRRVGASLNSASPATLSAAFFLRELVHALMRQPRRRAAMRVAAVVHRAQWPPTSPTLVRRRPLDKTSRLFNHPFPGTAPGRARCGAADRARCSHAHEPVRSPYKGRIRPADASLVAGSRRNRRTSGYAEGPSRSRNQDSRWLLDVFREIDRCRPGAPAAGSAADVVWFGPSTR